MRKLFVLLFIILFFVTLGGGFILYTTLDEANYKRQIIEATEKLVNRTVVIDGGVKVQFSPVPKILATNVRIKNIPGSKHPYLADIPKVEATISWDSLFENPLVIEQITLFEPSLFFERSSDGLINWDFPFLSPETPSDISGQDFVIGKNILETPPKFKNIFIKNGKISYTNAIVNISQTLDQLNGTISASSLKGPFNFTGSLNWRKIPIQTELAMGALSSSKTEPTSIKITLTDRRLSNAKIDFSGTIRNLLDAGSMEGTILFNAPNVDSLLQAVTGRDDLPNILNQPMRGTANFLLEYQKINFKNIALQYGNKELENSLSGDFTIGYSTKKNTKPNIMANLIFSKVEMDSFLPLFAKETSLIQIIRLLNKSIYANLDLNIKATSILYKRASLSNTSLVMTRTNDAFNIKEFKTTLPGDTTINANGEIQEFKEFPAGKVSLEIISKELSKTFEWMELEPSLGLSYQNMKNLKLKTVLYPQTTEVRASKIDATLDDATFGGEIAFSLIEKKPRFSINGNFHNINLNTYFPIEMPLENQSFSTLLGRAYTTLEQSTFWDKADLNLELTGTDISFYNVPISKMSYTGRLENGALTTTSFKLEKMATADLTVSGVLKKAEGILTFDKLSYDFKIDKTLLLADRAKINIPLKAFENSIHFKGILSGQPQNFDFEADSIFTQAHIQAKGKRQIVEQKPTYQAKIEASHPDALAFIQLFNPNFKIFPRLTGSLNIQSSVAGDFDSFTLSDIDGILGNQRLKGEASFTKGKINVLKATLTSPLLYIEKVLPNIDSFASFDNSTERIVFSKNLFNLSFMDNLDLNITLDADKILWGEASLDLASVHFTLKDKLFSIDSLKGKTENGDLSIKTSLNWASAEPVISFQSQAQNIHLPTDLLRLGNFKLKESTLSFSTELKAKGNSIEDMVASLSGNGNFTIQDGIISGLNLPSTNNQILSSLEQRQSINASTLITYLSTGETPFLSLSGSFGVANGVFTSSDANCVSDVGNGMMQLTYDLQKWNVLANIAFNFAKLQGYPPITILAKGIINNPKAEIDLSSFNKYLNKDTQQRQDADQKDKKLKEQQQIKMNVEARKKEAIQIQGLAHQKLAQTQKVLELANATESDESGLILAKDSGSIIDELALKANISVADLQKIEEQFSALSVRCDQIQQDVSAKALVGITKEIQTNFEMAQKYITDIQRIYQSLPNVPIVSQAYNEGIKLLATIQSLKNQIESGINDFNQSHALFFKSQETLELIQKTYNSVAKFDTQKPIEGMTQTTEPTVSGKITRRKGI